MTFEMILNEMRQGRTIVSDDPNELLSVLEWLKSHGYHLSNLAEYLLDNHRWSQRWSQSGNDGIIYMDGEGWFGVGNWKPEQIISYSSIRHVFEDDLIDTAELQAPSDEEVAAFLGICAGRCAG